MHVSIPKSKTELRQGSIFSFEKLKFDIEKEGKLVGFDYFYKEVDLEGIDFGIVVTQDCDCVLGQKKVTHLNIGLLEPIDRKKKENPLEIMDIDGNSFIKEFLNLKFYVVDEIGSIFKNKMMDLVNNNDAHFIFIEIDSKFYYVNLTKIFSLKIKHYDALISNTKFELANGFNYMLGWKMANMFGRVGVDLYEPKRRDEIAKKIVEDASRVIFSAWPDDTIKLTSEHFKSIKSDWSQFQTTKDDKKKQALRDKILKNLEVFGYIKK